jgi:site-specific recombinase XerC
LSIHSTGLGDADRLVVSPRQAWHMLGIGNTRGYELLAAGELDSYLEGRARRITVESIRAHIARGLAAESATAWAPRRAPRKTAAPLYVFVSERGAPLSVAGYQRMVARAGVAARFPFLIHSHMLRHSTGYKLANDGHDTRAIQGYLGHRSIVSTQRYTALAPDRFKRFWKD